MAELAGWPSAGGPGDGYYLQLPVQVMNKAGGFEKFRDMFLESVKQNLAGKPIGNLRGFQVLDKGGVVARYTLPEGWDVVVDEDSDHEPPSTTFGSE